MSVKSYSVTVTGASAISLTPTDNDLADGAALWIYGEFHGSSDKVAIGGPDVTIANGVHLYGAEKFGPVHLAHGETLYAIAATGPLDVRVLATGA